MPFAYKHVGRWLPTACPDILISVHVSAIKSWASELDALKSLWQKYPNDEHVFPGGEDEYHCQLVSGLYQVRMHLSSVCADANQRNGET